MAINFGFAAPKKTATGSVGFSFGAAGKAKAKPKAAPKAMGLFAEAMEADEKKEEVEEKKGVFQSMRFEAMQSKVLQAQQEVLLKEDPSVFAYDETKDSDDDEKLDGPELGKTWEDPSKSGGQKPSGLTVRGDGPIKRAAQYIDGVGRATLIRTLEQEIIEEKRLKKEREESGVHDEEVYVTNGYKDRLKQREDAQVKLNVKDAKDLAKCVTKQGESGGFALAGLAKSMMSATMRGRKGPEEVKKPEVKAESAVKTEAGAGAPSPSEEQTQPPSEGAAGAAAPGEGAAPDERAASGEAPSSVKAEPEEPAEPERCVPSDWNLDEHLAKKERNKAEEKAKAEWMEAQKRKRASTEQVSDAKARFLARKAAKLAAAGE